MVNRVGVVPLFGKEWQPIQVSGRTTSVKDTARTNGRMEILMLAHGKLIKWKVKACWIVWE